MNFLINIWKPLSCLISGGTISVNYLSPPTSSLERYRRPCESALLLLPGCTDHWNVIQTKESMFQREDFITSLVIYWFRKVFSLYFSSWLSILTKNKCFWFTTPVFWLRRAAETSFKEVLMYHKNFAMKPTEITWLKVNSIAHHISLQK